MWLQSWYVHVVLTSIIIVIIIVAIIITIIIILLVFILVNGVGFDILKSLL